ncbi:hypothetical protein LTR36_000313 [Oleoguttula mirabilis]|uniref:DUF7587 domain-containing protein n=1 Tax=Oleoguttula mirabilis TaxID=1507867 RepID=A0AAV9JYJ9_9PEZI|nr:hypothetical protein LTR36_000313 [Oleoguttula mirabilis]
MADTPLFYGPNNLTRRRTSFSPLTKYKPCRRNMPNHLFRVWSDQSNGTNTGTLFAPASTSGVNNTKGGLTDENTTSNIGEQLRTAFLGQHAPANPFIFFTNTLLFALQLAAFMKAKDHTNIYLTCIIVDTAKSTDGRPVVFSIASSMLKEHGVELRNRSDNSVCDYEGVFVSSTAVYIGKGSLCIAYESLIKKGLFQLYPELGAVTQRRDVRLQLTVSDLRKYWFDTARSLTDEKVRLAAKLATAFSPVTEGAVGGSIPTHLFAALLALQKRDVNDPPISRCIDRRSASRQVVIDLTEEDVDGAISSNAGLPEVEQYEALMNFIDGREIHRSYLNATSVVGPSTIAKETADWTAWHKQSRVDSRAARPERWGGERADRRRQESDRYRERREERGRNVLHSRPRLSREEYHASMLARGSRPERRSGKDRRSRSPVKERRQCGKEGGRPGRW